MPLIIFLRLMMLLTAQLTSYVCIDSRSPSNYFIFFAITTTRPTLNSTVLLFYDFGKTKRPICE